MREKKKKRKKEKLKKRGGKNTNEADYASSSPCDV